jgi:hypothetical protein
VIVEQPDLGRHNANLGAAYTRIVEGGTWKQQRTLMLLPAAKMVSSRAALSWLNMIVPPNQSFARWLLLGDEVGVAYSNAIEAALAHPELSKWEYILTVEHDNVLPQDGFLRLLRQMEGNPGLACISGLYFTKGEGGVPQIWGDVSDPVPNYRPQPPVADRLIECYGVGMGFALFRMSMFKDKNLPRPLFRTKASTEEGVGTQDLTFWGEAHKLGYRCAVDCGVLVGHIDPATDITW